MVLFLVEFEVCNASWDQSHTFGFFPFSFFSKSLMTIDLVAAWFGSRLTALGITFRKLNPYKRGQSLLNF